MQKYAKNEINMKNEIKQNWLMSFKKGLKFVKTTIKRQFLVLQTTLIFKNIALPLSVWTFLGIF